MLIALTGKPSVGKSSFYRAATLASAEVANYPFTTIKSAEATAYVKIDCVDKDFNTQCNPRMGYCIDHNRFIPVRLMDVPGLIPGAHKGEGLGNLFLDDLNQADALIHVIDISGSTNEKGEPVTAGSYDPSQDIKFLENELDQWYLRIIKNGWNKFIRQTKAEGGELYKAIAKQLSGLRVTETIAKETLNELQFSNNLETWSEKEVEKLASTLRSKTKPMIIAANKVDVSCGMDNLVRLRKEYPDYTIIPCSAESELALKEAAKKEMIHYIPGEKEVKITGNLNEGQKNAIEFIDKNILQVFDNTGVQKVMDTVAFEVLNLIAIFPGGVNNLTDKDGNVIPDCFLIKKGSTALDFAFKLHTDIGKGFIRAIDVKTKRTVGKDHELKHRDVIEIITRA
ncbi:MAG: redox-regulated ATPase YchF [Nanoarchaeota archaeon]|nr:redox-regulated ATPase YchF [Nanoarchaeota archaeon]